MVCFRLAASVSWTIIMIIGCKCERLKITRRLDASMAMLYGPVDVDMYVFDLLHNGASQFSTICRDARSLIVYTFSSIDYS